MELLDQIKAWADAMNFSVSIIDSSAERKCIFVNRSFENQMAYSRNELIGKSLIEIFGTNGFNYQKEQLLKLSKENSAYCQDIITQSKKNDYFLNRFIMIPLRTESKNIFIAIHNELYPIDPNVFNNKIYLNRLLNDSLSISLNHYSYLRSELLFLNHSKFLNHFEASIRRIRDFLIYLEDETFNIAA